MILTDVNILVYAFREDAEDHDRYREWLEDVINGDETYGVSDHVLSGFIRVTTNPRTHKSPSTTASAMAFADTLRDQPHASLISPGDRHWDIFRRLCLDGGAKGNLVPDAYFAALAIESGSEWITTDREYARFPGLRWRTPF